MKQEENRQKLEQELLEYWYSIPNDRINPAKNPFKIRITNLSQTTINYEKINAFNRVTGVGVILRKDLDYYRKICSEYKSKKDIFDPH